jgi:predicted lysophospholipase L1 biosynthesis ABC-type transport system permease subunit
MLTRMVFQSLARNRRISAWMLATLATCAALVTLFATVSIEVGHNMSSALRRVGANAVAVPAASSPVDWTAFQKIARSEGATVALLRTRVGLISGKPLAVVAAAPDELQQLTPFWALTGQRPAAPGECLVGRHVADALHLKVGDNAIVTWPRGGPRTTLRVSGMADTGDEDEERVFVITFGAVSADEFPAALLSVPGGEEAIARLQQSLASSRVDVTLKPLRQILHGERQVLDKVNILFLAALGAVLVLTALGVSACMLARVVERRKELALLQALGATKRAVVGFLLAESAVVGVLASAAGFGVGALMAEGVVRQIFRVSVLPHWSVFGSTLAVTVVVALLAGGIASSRAMRQQPAAALRGE